MTCDGANPADITDNYGLALDVAGGKIYESSQNSGEIFSYNLDGSNQQVIVSGLDGPTYMDYADGYLYVGSWLTSQGYKINLADNSQSPLNYGVASWGTVVDPVGGKFTEPPPRFPRCQSTIGTGPR